MVGLPGDRVSVPEHADSVSVQITGLTAGVTMVTASLNGSSATSAVTVNPPPPAVEQLACPERLAVGATALCSVHLSATPLTDTTIPLATSDAGVLTIPENITVPAHALSAPFSVTAAGPGQATLTAGPLTPTRRRASVQVLLPPPATARLTLSLNAAQPMDTEVPLAVSPAGIVSGPPTVTVPAGRLSAPLTVTGLTPGTATLTAGPLNGTQAQCALSVTQGQPTVTGLAPDSLRLPQGKAGTLAVTIAPTQPEPTAVPLRSSDPSVEVPGSVTVPAGSALAEFPVLPRREGSATVTAGPLNGTSQQASVTVTSPELVTLRLTPPSPTIAAGQTAPFTALGTYPDGSTQDLTGTATWMSSDAAIATIAAGGIATGHKEGQVAITATLETVTATASLSITPPVLASLAVSPASPTRLVGQTVQFAAMGTRTDGTTQDLTTAVTWSSNNQTVASIIETGPSAGLATSLAPGATTITATHPEGFTGSTLLTVSVPLPPTIISFTPPGGPVGTLVTLTGMNLDSTIQVAFNGRMAAFTVLSPTQLTATVPVGTSTGPITVTGPGGSALTTASFTVALPPVVTITSPVDGATIASDRVIVTGTLQEVVGEVGVVVNGIPASVLGTRWAVQVPILPDTTSLTATVSTSTGLTAQATIGIQVTNDALPPLVLDVFPAGGAAPLAVTFQLQNNTGRALVQFELDTNGDGAAEVTTEVFGEPQATYGEAQLVIPIVRARDDQGQVYTAQTLIAVGCSPALEAKWEGLKAALRRGDLPAALSYVHSNVRARYEGAFRRLTPAQLVQVDQILTAALPVEIGPNGAEYEMRRWRDGELLSFPIWFQVDTDGIWRLAQF